MSNLLRGLRQWAFVILLTPLAAGAAKSVTVPMENLAGAAFRTVNVSLGEYGQVKMLVDTAAPQTVLASWTASERKIPILNEIEVGQVELAELTKFSKAGVTRLKVGGRERHVKFLAVVPMPEALQRAGVGGIFSPHKFFHNEDLVLDFPANKMRAGAKLTREMRGSFKLAGQGRMRSCGVGDPNRYQAELNIGPLRGWLLLNSGAAHTTLGNAFSRQLGTAAAEVAIGLGQTSRELPLRVSAIETRCALSDGQVGGDFLNRYAVLLTGDRRELRLYRPK